MRLPHVRKKMEIDDRARAREPATRRERSVVVVLSTMRSGSTLLKALLATAPDVSDLPEVDFQRFRHRRHLADIRDMSGAPVVVLKRPAWFHEVLSYPKLPRFEGVRKIVLFRDAYETVRSLRKMIFHRLSGWTEPFFNSLLAEHYWCRVTENLLNVQENDPEATIPVRYEDLVVQPEEVTRRLFSFIGSAREEGVNSYNPPTHHKWSWGKDDGGTKIRSLQVQPPPPTDYANRHLASVIRESERIARLRERLGYKPLPDPGISP
ncbi:sulfotransferase family protein [Kiritimatiella glycovorans]|uniref:Sulfotransferase domain protein n=1 Tax=Kiritimatiella glycovorans TaxID=1307763 RepID=A0A0G3EF08_9BACT|nr:sulfotransferase [Kiritimatiella glycovorans]AKJ63345.1 hypothetical protein L21SP4_00057 [Kiritimatiella glycovorans]